MTKDTNKRIKAGLEQVAKGQTVPVDENFVSDIMGEVEGRRLPEGFESADREEVKQILEETRTTCQPVLDYLKDK